MSESQIVTELSDKLVQLKYVHRPDIRDWVSLETNFRAKFEDLWSHGRYSLYEPKEIQAQP